MILAEVLGPVVMTIKHDSMQKQRFLKVQPCNENGQGQGTPFIAIDKVSALEGQKVVVLREGTGARQVLEGVSKTSPIRSVIIGIVDDIDDV